MAEVSSTQMLKEAIMNGINNNSEDTKVEQTTETAQTLNENTNFNQKKENVMNRIQRIMEARKARRLGRLVEDDEEVVDTPVEDAEVEEAPAEEGGVDLAAIEQKLDMIIDALGLGDAGEDMPVDDDTAEVEDEACKCHECGSVQESVMRRRLARRLQEARAARRSGLARRLSEARATRRSPLARRLSEARVARRARLARRLHEARIARRAF